MRKYRYFTPGKLVISLELTIHYQIKKAKVIDPAQLPQLVLGGTRYLVPGTLVQVVPVPWYQTGTYTFDLRRRQAFVFSGLFYTVFPIA